MNREALEHIIRAAADVSEDDEIVVVGSQAILGQFPHAPEPLLVSQEADVYPRNRPEKAIEIDAALGDGSQFHETFGYYAHGVGPETAKAPAGWETRLVPVRVASRSGAAGEATGWCMEAHDLVLAKCAAGRKRDWEFAKDAIRHGVVDPAELLRRAPDLPLHSEHLNQLQAVLDGIAGRG
ncbi:MAG TPA: DUF6036 family nucleotidyltransferase [Solirubrobacteraceae bacterium]